MPAGTGWGDGERRAGSGLTLNVPLKAKTLEELWEARKVQTEEFSRTLCLDYELMTGGKKPEKLQELIEEEIKSVKSEFFNNNKNFSDVQQRLFSVYMQEMAESLQDELKDAEYSVGWLAKVRILKNALRLTER